MVGSWETVPTTLVQSVMDFARDSFGQGEADYVWLEVYRLDYLHRSNPIDRRGWLSGKINEEYARDPMKVNAIVSVSHANTIARLRTMEDKAEYFLILLNLARLRECHLDIDHVYAVIGLLDPETRADIQERGLVNYHTSPKDLFMKIARRYLLTPAVGLHVLTMASSTARTSVMPSWCPDWGAKLLGGRLLSSVPSYRAGIPPGSVRTHPITKGEIEEQVFVQGFKIDVVKDVGKPWQPSGVGRISEDAEQELRTWEESCHSIAASALGSPDFQAAYIRTLIGNVVGTQPLPCAEDFTEEYRHLLKHMKECSDNACNHSATDEAKYLRFCASMGQQCTGRRLFSTESTRIGMGPADLRTGDQVCVFMNGRALYILRNRKEAASHQSGGITDAHELESSQKIKATTYELVGEAYVDGLMDGEAFTSGLRGSDESFCVT